MTNLKNALIALLFLLMLGGSTVAASAQTTVPSNTDCQIRNAPARPVTFHPTELPLAPVLSGYPMNGTAIVRVDITENGTPRNATIERSSGSYLLDQAAIKTVLNQEFAPEIRDCVPVAGSYLYEVED
jgi:TonB family protein